MSLSSAAPIKPCNTIAALPAYSVNEEIANAVSHGLGAILSVIGMVVLISNAAIAEDMLRVVSFSIYGTSMVLLFLASTLYHSVVDEKLKQLFKLLDHCAIYLLIAGSYTPLMLISLQGTLGYTMLALVWLIALGGILFKIKFGHKYKKISLTTYLGMGFLSLPIIHKLSQALPEGGLTLLAAGGAVYCAGVFFYVKKTVPYTHAIWHLFVLGGAACHFFLMLYYV